MSDMAYTSSACNLEQFSCFDLRSCVPIENVRKFEFSRQIFLKLFSEIFQVCDSVFQCMDGSDEKYCAPKKEDSNDNDDDDALEVETDDNEVEAMLDEGTWYIVN